MPSTLPNPPSATEVEDYYNKLDALILALEHHPLMTPTPAPGAPKGIYFTWDFVQRTKHMLTTQIDMAALMAGDSAAMETWTDVVSRGILIGIIIADGTDKAANMFNAGVPMDYGEEVRARARELGS